MVNSWHNEVPFVDLVVDSTTSSAQALPPGGKWSSALENLPTIQGPASNPTTPWIHWILQSSKLQGCLQVLKVLRLLKSILRMHSKRVWIVKTKFPDSKPRNHLTAWKWALAKQIKPRTVEQHQHKYYKRISLIISILSQVLLSITFIFLGIIYL